MFQNKDPFDQAVLGILSVSLAALVAGSAYTALNRDAPAPQAVAEAPAEPEQDMAAAEPEPEPQPMEMAEAEPTEEPAPAETEMAEAEPTEAEATETAETAPEPMESEETAAAEPETSAPEATETAEAEPAEAEAMETAEAEPAASDTTETAEAEPAASDTTETAEAEPAETEAMETAEAADAPAAEEATAEAGVDGWPEAQLAYLEGDAGAGQRVWNQCRACHVADQEQNRVGPHLVNVIGRDIASIEGFRYSQALQDLQGQEWTPEEMDAWLENPRDYAAGTSMSYRGLQDEEDRRNLLAYLWSLQN